MAGKGKPVQNQRKLHIRRGDEVVVVAGEDRGRRGKVLDVDRDRNRVTVEGVNRVKVHQRPTQKNPHGGIVEREQPVHVSNVMVWDGTEQKATRIGRQRLSDGRRVRYAKTSGETLEE